MVFQKGWRKKKLEEEGEPTREDISIGEEPITQEPIDVASTPPEENIQPSGEYETPQPDVSTMRIITKVDSPVDIKQVFWSFVTKDISMSNITENDFKYILTNLKLRLYNFIQKYPIEEWDNIKFAEYESKIEPVMVGDKIAVDKDGQPMYMQKKFVKNSWDFSELLIDLEEFVYHQLTRGRQGFTFRRLTETFQVSEFKKEAGESSAGGKSGWKLW